MTTSNPLDRHESASSTRRVVRPLTFMTSIHVGILQPILLPFQRQLHDTLDRVGEQVDELLVGVLRVDRNHAVERYGGEVDTIDDVQPPDLMPIVQDPD